MSDPTKCPYCGMRSYGDVDCYVCGTRINAGAHERHTVCLRIEIMRLKERVERLIRAGSNLMQICEAQEVDFHLADKIELACEEWRKAKLSVNKTKLK